MSNNHNRNISIVTAFFSMVILWPSAAHALVEVQVDCEQFNVDAKPETAQPTVGGVATKPTSLEMDEAGNAKVVVEVVEALKGKAIVIENQAGGADVKCCLITFGGSKPSHAEFTGKVYVHFDWVSLSHKTGNIGFAALRNSKLKPILSLMFSFNTKDVDVLVDDESTEQGYKLTELPSVVELGKAVAVDIVLDLDQWHYEVSLDGKKSAKGSLAKTDNNSFLDLSFYTPPVSTSSFAIKNVIVSPNPINR